MTLLDGIGHRPHTDDHYRGWWISYGSKRPVTGTWRATRYGVGMCAGSREALVRMIDQKVNDEQREKK